MVDFLEVHRDGEEGSFQDEPLDGLGTQTEVSNLLRNSRSGSNTALPLRSADRTPMRYQVCVDRTPASV